MVATARKTPNPIKHLHAREAPIVLEWEALEAPHRSFGRQAEREEDALRARWRAEGDEF